MAERIIIGIDPGHLDDAGDHGCASKDGRLIEDVWVMSLARALRSHMLGTGEPFSPKLLRTRDDEVVSYPERARLATELECDLALCLHVNSWHTPEYRGGIILHWPGNDLGRKIAEEIACSYPRCLRLGRHAVAAVPGDWPRAHALMSCYPQTTVIVEAGYASSAHDLDALLESSVQASIIGAIMQGLRWMRQARECRWLAA